MNDLRIGSTCSGYGGLELAIAAVLGGRTVWHAEIDRAASRVLAHHWPGVRNLGDVTTTDWTHAEPIDIYAAGFPCTTVSQAGAQGGLLAAADDTGLWPTRAPWEGVRDGIAALRPRLVIIENVRGLLNAPVGHGIQAVGGGFGRVLGDLADLGFDAEWMCNTAAESGAPHRRTRVFIVAANTGRVGVQRRADGAGLPGPQGPGEGEGLQRQRGWDPAGDGGAAAPHPGDLGLEDGHRGQPGTATPLGGAAAAHPGGEARDIGPGLRPGGPGRVGWGRPDDRGVSAHADPAGPRRGPEDDCPPGGGAGPAGLRAAQPRRRGRDTAADPDRDRREGLPACDRAHRGLDVEHRHHPDRRGVDDRWGSYGDAVYRWERTLGRRAPDPTVLGHRRGTRLNPEFVEWMMGLEQGHVTAVPGIDRKAQLRLLGNGVVPQQAAAAIRTLLPRLADVLAPTWEVSA